MSDMNRSFAGSMPEFYDRILVPVMFEPFALDLAERLGGITTGRVLEVAAGNRVVPRALVRLLAAGGSDTATPPNPAMRRSAQMPRGDEGARGGGCDAVGAALR